MKTSVLRELRAVQRFKVELPVVLTSRSGDGGQSFDAVTRDVSTRGMFVLSKAPIPDGQILNFELDLAWDDVTPLVLVRGEGRVVRVEHDSQSERVTGFAVENLWFKLREPEEGEAIPTDALSTFLSAPHSSAVSSKPHRGLSIVPKAGELDKRGM